MFIRIFSCILLFVMIYCSSAYAENCIVYDQVISGKYMITEKGPVCKQCYLKHGAVYCSACRILIQGPYKSIGTDPYYKAKNKNSIYGGVFRKILMLEKKLGTVGLLEYTQTHRSFSDK